MLFRLSPTFAACLVVLASFAAFAQQPPDAFQVGNTGDFTVADSFVNFNNSATANICVNTYMFTSDGSMYGCCATLATANQVYSMSARNAFPFSLSLSQPSSFVVKLVASQPIGGATCNAAAVTAETLTSGMQSWIAPSPGGPGVPLLKTQLNPCLKIGTNPQCQKELDVLTQFCAFIQTNGGGVGLCRSAQPVPAPPNASDQSQLLYWIYFFL